jgi:hypothetical protein
MHTPGQTISFPDVNAPEVHIEVFGIGNQQILPPDKAILHCHLNTSLGPVTTQNVTVEFREFRDKWLVYDIKVD